MSWEEVKDAEGRLYYYNSDTQQTQWEKPDELESIVDKVIRENTHWSLFTTEEGKNYYYNNDSGESVWTCPDAVREVLLAKGLDIPEEEEAVEEDEVAVEGQPQDEMAVDEKEDDKHDENDIKDEDKMDEDSDLVADRPHGSTPGNNLVKLSDLIEANKSVFEQERSYLGIDYTTLDPEESKQQFMDMLAEKVDGNWPFNKVMETFINDLRYWQIQDSLIRKNLYDLYLIQLADKEFAKVEDSREKYKASFFKMLSSYPQITYYTRWKTCQSLILDESLYSIVPGKLKHEFFEEYVNKLRSEQETKHREIKRHALQELEDFFRTSLKLNITVSWDDILHTLKADQRFKDNKNMISLNDLDILTVYESIMNETESNFEKELRMERKKNFRSDRQARDGFKELLQEIKLASPERMNAKTKWFEFVALLKDDPRFIELCGRRGSSPIDFYWDFIDQENQILNAKKDIVSQVLISYNEKPSTVDEKFVIPLDYQFTTESDLFSLFVKIVEDSKRLKEYSSTDLSLIFELIVQETTKKSSAPKDEVTDSTATTDSSITGNKRKIDDVSPSPEPSANEPKKRLATLGYGIVKSLP